MNRRPSTKRQLSVLSSDSDDYDISKIKKQYNPDYDPKKQSTSGSTKEKKQKKSVDRNQMTIEKSFGQTKTAKPKSENTLEHYFKKDNVKPKKEEISASDFFSKSKNKKVDTNNNKNLEKKTPEKSMPMDVDKTKFVIEKPTNPSPEAVKPESDKHLKHSTPVKSTQNMEKLVSPSPSNSKKAYHSFINRSGPSAPGSKPIPEGAQNCLAGLTFVLTGVLESLDRDDAQNLIIKYGGRVTKAISGKTSYLVVGSDAGNSKIDKAASLKTKQISEDELLDLIANSKPSQVATPTRNKSSSKTEKLSKIKEEKINPDPKVIEKSSVKDEKIDNKASKSNNEFNKVTLSAQPIVCTKPAMGPGQAAKKPAPTSTSVGATATTTRGSNSTLLVDKYRPTTMKQLIGQQGDRSSANKLRSWLENWHANRIAGFQKRPDQDGAHLRSVLLSGSPGIGKTSTVLVVARELGFEVRECNASLARTRNDLNEFVPPVNSMRIGQQSSNKFLLLMDEVDGMSGNEDRGGMTALIAGIRAAPYPIVCVCNDRQSQKIRSLANYTYDLRFRALTPEQVRAAVKSVAFKEHIAIPDDRALTELVLASNCDLRQILNTIQLMSVQSDSLGTSEEHATVVWKQAAKGPFEVVRRVFTHDGARTFSEKLDLFFEDYQLGGLFVQENYPNVVPFRAKGDMRKTLKLMSLAADSIAESDVVSRPIRARNDWSLLPMQGMLSSVLPGEYLHGRLSAQIAFPGWLGKFSKYNKSMRTLSQLCLHLRVATKGGISSPMVLAMEYGPVLADRVLRPLREGDVDTTLGLMQDLDLLREDVDLLIESTTWPAHGDRMASIPSQVKATLTRAVKKAAFKMPYTIQTDVKRARGGGGADMDEAYLADEMGLMGGESVDARTDQPGSDGDDDDAVENDAMIVKKKSQSKSKKADKKPAAPAKPKKEPKTAARGRKRKVE